MWVYVDGWVAGGGGRHPPSPRPMTMYCFALWQSLNLSFVFPFRYWDFFFSWRSSLWKYASVFNNNAHHWYPVHSTVTHWLVWSTNPLTHKTTRHVWPSVRKTKDVWVWTLTLLQRNVTWTHRPTSHCQWFIRNSQTASTVRIYIPEFPVSLIVARSHEIQP